MSKTSQADIKLNPLTQNQLTDAPKPSAFMVAALRAAHQFLDSPIIFPDPIAFKILGVQLENAMRQQQEKYRDPFSNGLRTALVVRSRVAEDAWAQARLKGVRQYVILGAGMDTFAYRDTVQDDSMLFEVDLATTQTWKREALRKAEIAEPSALRFVSVDFETENLLNKLIESGFNPKQPAFFSWLGVAIYLEPESVKQTLQQIGSLAVGSSIVFDYAIQEDMLTPMTRIALGMLKKRVADQGEPWKSSFAPAGLINMLTEAGFHQCDDLTPEILTARYLAERNDGLRLSGVSHIMHATV